MKGIKAVSKEFPKEVLLELADGVERACVAGLTLIDAPAIVDTNRWSIIKSFVFQETSTGKFYRSTFSTGATEIQDEGPYEHADDMVPCVEVRSTEKTVVEYVPVRRQAAAP